MSEIFRGKVIGKDWWAYGAYSFNPVAKRGFIVNIGFDSDGPIVHLTEVDPSTKGQFTGLYDATTWNELTPAEQKIYKQSTWKGRMIFEGDILEAHYDEYFPESATRTVVEWSKIDQGDVTVGWYMNQEGRGSDPIYFSDVKQNRVIGNIHENADLLEDYC